MKHIHFIGVCGTAMASVAAEMKNNGFRITGSDANAYPPMSTFLEEKGVQVHSGYQAENLTPQPDLVVIGNALSRGNPEVEEVLNRKCRYCSLPELLKEFYIRGKRSIVITGTHGKTTVTSLMAWVFETAGFNPGFLIGGIPYNFGFGARFTDSPWFIIEGDEYDTAFFDKRSKFVHYLPEIVVINNLEFDHADIFPDLKSIQIMFKRLINLIPGNGLLLVNGDDPNATEIIEKPFYPVSRFGLGRENPQASRAINLDLDSDQSRFQCDGFTFAIPLTGEFNVRNALAVTLCARHCGISNEIIQKAFDSFRGIKRRMEIRGEINGILVIDDFGHHPTAIQATLKALRLRYPRRRIWAVFEPRSNTTRRNIFQNELVEALGFADIISVSQVARLNLLKECERLNPEKLIQDLTRLGRKASYHPNADSIIAQVHQEAQPGDVICAFSNGGFEDIHNRILKTLNTLNHST